MTASQRRLIDMLVRFHNRVDDMFTQQAEAEDCDREFDGGEFSGPVHAALREELGDRIARRLGFDSADVAAHWTTVTPTA